MTKMNIRIYTSGMLLLFCSTSIQVSAQSSSAIFVDTSGKVGINTNTPAQTLDVNGNVSINGDVSINGALKANPSLPFKTLLVDGSLAVTNHHITYKSINGVINWGENYKGSLYFRSLKSTGDIAAYTTLMSIDSRGENECSVSIQGDEYVSGTGTCNKQLISKTQTKLEGNTQIEGSGKIYLNGNDNIIKLTHSDGQKLLVNNWGHIYVGKSNVDNILTYPVEIDAVNEVNVPKKFAFFVLYSDNKIGYGQAEDNTSTKRKFSLMATGAIATKDHFFTYSDERIKKNICPSPINEDLELIKKLKVVTYQYKDNITHGDNKTNGFIAQQVEQYFPTAVTHISDYIPNIYSLAKSISSEANNVCIATDKEHGLVPGDKIKLITPNGTFCETITDCDKTSFSFSDNEFHTSDADSIFVFGKEIQDARMVDYERIFTLNVAATQELAKQVELLKEENETLRKTNEAIQDKLATSDGRINEVEEKIEALVNKLKENTKLAANK